MGVRSAQDISTALEEGGVCDLEKCARCGRDHPRIQFQKLLNPVRDITHWAMCPVTEEPILMRVLVVYHEDKMLLQGRSE